MFTELKTEVCRVNKALVDSGLVILTWGNVSGAGFGPMSPEGTEHE
jgi:ribulose-5-phosphate 4-epimerase/fuculose-1-phosphate aldolase